MKLECLLLVAALGMEAAPRGVEILWDKYGVAHVYARDKEGMFYGYGYAQMQSHANLILKLYGESRGRGAEYWGPKGLELDQWVHLNEVPQRAEQWYRMQTPEFKKYLVAFAEGMNEYAKRHPEAIGEEYRQVLPVEPVDSLRHVHRIVHFSYVSSQMRVKAAATGRSGEAGGIGSNAWAIMPKKSAAGTPMLLMNPHLPWQDWYTYCEVHLNGPGMNLYGASQVGFPVLRFVFSDYLGFTQTVNSIDASDLYRITPDGEGYRFDGEKKSYEKTRAVIKVKGGADVVMEIKKTVHGPVVWDEGGKVIAMRTGGLDRPYLLEQYWKMAIAKNFAEYQAQVSRLEVPTFNITYADKDGHVMYLFNGTLPKRKSGDLAYWAGIVPGDRSETLWTEYHRYEELPKVVDPPSGWVQNTNDPPWTATLPSLDWTKYPEYAAGKDYTMRSRSSLEMLTREEKLSFEKLEEYKHSTRLVMADRMLDDLLAAAPEGAAKKVLAGWDRKADNGSVGAVLFEELMKGFRPEWKLAADPKRPLETPMGLKNAAAGVAALERAAAEVVKRHGRLDVPYGEVNRLRYRGANLPGNGADGGLGAFRVIRFGPKGPVHGETFVALVEWQKGGPRAKVLVSYGSSSQPGTKHDVDQLPLLSEKKMRNAWRTRKEVERNLESKDVF
ncbi:MAG: penicillin acylase family protein [Bryobacter sp.]|jgi:acyl-homoserine-lactone acylase|nr:penicillin acylase family protein [Bryobacter sp. CoA8 C33]